VRPFPLPAAAAQDTTAAIDTACSLDQDGSYSFQDPNLHVMEYDVGDGPQTTMVYVEPDVTSFYRSSAPPSTQKVTPLFEGFQAKFVNLSNQTVAFFWEDTHSRKRHLMRYLAPFHATGTASFPKHQFVMTPRDDESTVLVRLQVQAYPHNNHYYDPYRIRENPTPPSFLNEREQQLYTRWRKTILFDDQYLQRTGRSYLAHYRRDPPLHFMWPAEFLGQTHWITTLETHFQELPPPAQLSRITTVGKHRRLRDDQPRLLAEYRDNSSPTLNLTLRVLSVAPRVLEIPNFLSPVEIQHILQVAHRHSLHDSTTGDSRGQETAQLKTRTSQNTWVSRGTYT
jgi:hypothetical protein